MSRWDLLLTDARIATMREGATGYGEIDDGALAIAAGKIAWIGPRTHLPSTHVAFTRSVAGRWLCPMPSRITLPPPNLTSSP